MKNIDGRTIEESKQILVYSIISPDSKKYTLDMTDYLKQVNTSDYKYRKDYYEAVLKTLPDYLPLKIKHYLIYGE